jgi:hypothetical protein
MTPLVHEGERWSPRQRRAVTELFYEVRKLFTRLAVQESGSIQMWPREQQNHCPKIAAPSELDIFLDVHSTKCWQRLPLRRRHADEHLPEELRATNPGLRYIVRLQDLRVVHLLVEFQPLATMAILVRLLGDLSHSEDYASRGNFSNSSTTCAFCFVS